MAFQSFSWKHLTSRFLFSYTESPPVTEPEVKMLAVQSALEEIAFKTKMVCNHARNPFTSQQLKASTTEDVIQHISEDKRPLNIRAVNSVACFQRKLPHGNGSLKTVRDKIIYSGDWRKGKSFLLCLWKLISFWSVLSCVSTLSFNLWSRLRFHLLGSHSIMWPCEVLECVRIIFKFLNVLALFYDWLPRITNSCFLPLYEILCVCRQETRERRRPYFLLAL